MLSFILPPYLSQLKKELRPFTNFQRMDLFLHVIPHPLEKELKLTKKTNPLPMFHTSHMLQADPIGNYRTFVSSNYRSPRSSIYILICKGSLRALSVSSVVFRSISKHLFLPRPPSLEPSSATSGQNSEIGLIGVRSQKSGPLPHKVA